MTPLEVELKLNKLRNWSVRIFSDASGNKCTQLCIPLQENGIDMLCESGALEPDGTDIKYLTWRFMATPSSKGKGDALYNLIPSMGKNNWQACLDRGLVDPERKNFHQICGNIKPWPFAFKKKKA